MIKFSLITFFLLPLLCIQGQTPVGDWSDHLRYNTARSLAAGNEEVYVSNGMSLMVFKKNISELRKLSGVNGLTEAGISAIAWSEQKKTLIVAYLSGGIDLVSGNTVYYISDVVRKQMQRTKNITRIRTSGNNAYLCSSFGLVVLDLDKKEIRDTWKPGIDASVNQVFDVTFKKNGIYAATSNGVYSGSLLNQGLSYFGNWNLINILPDPSGKYISLGYSGDKLYACLSEQDGDKVYVHADFSSLFYSDPGVYVNSIDVSPAGFTISTGKGVQVYDAAGTLRKKVDSYGWGEPSAMQAYSDNNDLWIADAGYGLVRGTNLTAFTSLSLPGPATNDVFYLASLNGRTIATGGGVSSSWNGLQKPLRVSVFSDNSWVNEALVSVKDPVRALIDPADNSHYMISSWGGGLLEYKGSTVTQFNDKNSPLQTSLPGSPGVKVFGLCIDENRYLWMTQSEVPGSIKVLKPDGTWITGFKTINSPVIGDIIIDRNGYKWILLPGGYGLCILNDNQTPEVTSDDKYMMTPVKDEKKVVSGVYSIASDLDGNIWVGTDQGPFIYSNPERIFRDDYLAYRIRVPRNEGSNVVDYMLGTETITAIAVDGANRKWLGTSTSGVYLLSSDGAKQLLNFNEENSPLLSNSINSISVDNKTGEVWFGTSAGLQSYRGNAVEGEDKFKGVYAFPNPVRESFSGNVTIAGLMRDTQVKITDVSGNLVFDTFSDGGLATWDLKNRQGKRVSTGVYLAFCSSPDGKKAVVTKILVIH